MVFFFDSKSYYKIFLISILLRVLTLYAAIGSSLTIIVFLLYVAAWHQIRDRYYVGLKILPFAFFADLLFAFLIFKNQFIATTAVVFSTLMAVFWLLTQYEQKYLPRPLYAMNDEEVKRARHALKTKNPRDLEQVIQYKDFSAIDKN